MEAMQAAILLMPDPNREALQTLLLFLNEVAGNSEINQVIGWLVSIFFCIYTIITVLYIMCIQNQPNLAVEVTTCPWSTNM